jgi:hypothetical protein
VFACLMCTGCRCGMTCSDEDRGRSSRPVAEDRGCRTGRVLGGRAVERSDDAVSGLHLSRRDYEREFLS